MIDTKDFTFLENHNNFDFKGFLTKLSSYWKWFLISLVLCLFVAYQVNLRKQKIYGLETSIALKEETNPLFTSNTSLIFNWGGSSDQMQTIGTTLKSRTHNELVVDRLQFYIDYLQETKYYTQDVYGQTPFVIEIDKSQDQVLGTPIEIEFLSNTEYQINIQFPSKSVSLTNYFNFEKNVVSVANQNFKKKYKFGQTINLPFLHFKVQLNQNPSQFISQKYIVRFNNFDDVVANYKGIKVVFDEKAASILRLSLEGSNKNRIVDYLNETVKTLIKVQLKNKNLFAENTIRYIDTTLALMEGNLKLANNDLKKFSQNKNVFEIEKGGEIFQDKMLDLDVQKDGVNRKINYYNTLNSYLRNSTDYSKLPAPSVAGIEDPNIMGNVSNLIQLSVRRSEMAYSVKSDVLFNNIDNEISSVKKVLLENISAAKAAIGYESAQVNSKIGTAENKIRQLPDDKQEYLKIMRSYNLSDNIYQTYLQKRSEASIVKASNLSDIKFIDSAKDIGGGLIGPKTEVNYFIAAFLGLFVPFIIIIILFFVNNNIQNTDDLNRLTSIPLLGVVGIKSSNSNLAVFEKPKSALAESFRSIRSSLQFLYKKQNSLGSKTVMITSSTAGEGKTFCSINIATVFALSEKKTVLVGLDLRKPKLFEDFNIDNSTGVVNYLIGQKTLDDVINKTQIPFLDVVTSGPIPPNPSELIMSENMQNLINSLKERYDYIILDTPPVGLVTDALELSTFADVTLYIARQNYTKKGMINLLNIRNKRGELNNVSLIFNGFENKAKYGYAYGYGFDYGYGSYSNGYHEDDKPQNIFVKLYKKLFNK